MHKLRTCVLTCSIVNNSDLSLRVRSQFELSQSSGRLVRGQSLVCVWWFAEILWCIGIFQPIPNLYFIIFIDPLVWWKENENQYPKIAKWAKRLLGAPPSSVESERLFSIGGNIYTPKRNRLTAENGETLMLLNFNLRAFNFDY